MLAGLFAWAAVVASPHPGRTGVLAAAATCAAATAWLTALLPARVRAITRLRGHGQLADAQVISVRRIFFSGSDYFGEPGYSAKITVSFADASGCHHAGQYYTRLTEPAQERLGQVIQIIYDPRRIPASSFRESRARRHIKPSVRRADPQRPSLNVIVLPGQIRAERRLGAPSVSWLAMGCGAPISRVCAGRPGCGRPAALPNRARQITDRASGRGWHLGCCAAWAWRAAFPVLSGRMGGRVQAIGTTVRACGEPVQVLDYWAWMWLSFPASRGPDSAVARLQYVTALRRRDLPGPRLGGATALREGP